MLTQNHMTGQPINNELITELITTIEKLSEKIDDIAKINQELLNKVKSLEHSVMPQKTPKLSKYIDKCPTILTRFFILIWINVRTEKKP